MDERFEIGGHKGVHRVVGVERRNVEIDARNFDKYPYLRTFNPHLLLASRIVDQMVRHGEVVLTAHKNGGPMIEVSLNGVSIGVGAAISEASLGTTIKSFDPRRIKDTEQAVTIAKKIIRDGKAVVFKVTP